MNKIICRCKKKFYLIFLIILLSISKASTQEKNLRFVVAGHLYPITKDLEKINKFAKKINNYKPDYVFILGDSNLQDKAIFDYLKTVIESDIYFSPGNNDLRISKENYLKNIGYLDKVIIDKNIKFILLNSSESKEYIIDFLEKNLRDDKTKNIILTHHRIWDDTIISKKPYEHDKSYYFQDLYPVIKNKVNYIFAGNSKRQYFRDLTDTVSYGKQNINLIYWLDKIENINAYSVGMGDGTPKAGFVVVDIKEGQLIVQGDYSASENYHILPKELISYNKNRLSLEHTSELKEFVKPKYYLVNKKKIKKIFIILIILSAIFFIIKRYKKKI